MSLLLSFAIGLVAGLRSMTAPAVVAWAAYLGWIHLEGSPLAFLGSRWAVALFSLCAIAEFIADQLPKTPARTTPGPLGARIVFGALTGAALAIAGAQSGWLGAFLGIAGAVVGAYAGYHSRVGLVRSLGLPDPAVAIPEDLLAIGLGLLFVTRF
jgi:uncharacterized membrane protein